ALAASSPQPRGSSFVVHGTARPDEPFSRFSPGAPLSDAIGFADGGARDETGEIIVVHDRGRGPLVPCERDETRVGALEGVRRIVRVTKDADRERPDEPLRR